MLLRFGLENHYSIRDYQALSFVATKLKDPEAGLIPVAEDDSDQDPARVVPVLALYGANASGKSGVIHALNFVTRFVRNSHANSSSQEKTPYFPFLLDKASRSKPSKYDIDIALDDTRFHYGFEIDGKRVVSEWLYSFPLRGGRKTRTVLFHRNADEEPTFYFGKTLRGENKQISRLVRANSLFLSAAAQNAHPQLTPIFDFFVNRIGEMAGPSEADLAEQLRRYFEESELRRIEAVRFLKAADIGVCGINFSRVPRDEKQIKFAVELRQLVSAHLKTDDLPPFDEKEQTDTRLMHSGEGGEPFPIALREESRGTTALLAMLGPIFERLSEGGVIVVDELNSTLHPLVSRKLIQLFSSKSTNPGGAQLIFSTHDTNLLRGRLLRRDQIFFTEKDAQGCTHLYSMSEIKVRASDDLEAGYLAGKFGAVPFLGIELEGDSQEVEG